MKDAINPSHYRSHPSGVECIQITEHLNFCLGNAVKYIWRAGLKDDPRQELAKSIWYLQRELARLERAEAHRAEGVGPGEAIRGSEA